MRYRGEATTGRAGSNREAATRLAARCGHGLLATVVAALGACGGGGGGGAADAAGCDDQSCAVGEACGATGCERSTYLDIAIEEVWYNGGVSFNIGRLNAYMPGADPVPDPVVYRSGACTAYAREGDPGQTSICLDAGQMVAEAGGVQAWADSSICLTGGYNSVLDFGTTRFAGGDALTLVAGGGADIGAFSGALVVPPTVEVTVPAIHIGASATITWTPGAGGQIDFDMTGWTYYARCQADDAAGMVTVDGSITAYLEGINGLEARRRVNQKIVVDGGGLIEFRFVRTDAHYVP